ncbi:uncharacterized protein ACDP82_011835 [Pangshura tecta]
MLICKLPLEEGEAPSKTGCLPGLSPTARLLLCSLGAPSRPHVSDPAPHNFFLREHTAPEVSEANSLREWSPAGVQKRWGGGRPWKDITSLKVSQVVCPNPAVLRSVYLTS